METVIERRAALTAALRSGEYAQAKGYLREKDGSGYCCLGVACDLYHKETGKGYWDERVFRDAGGDSNNSFLPRDVSAWFGFSGASGSFVKEVVSERGLKLRTLDGLNDFVMNFNEVADFIDSNPEGLFND